MKKRKLFYPFLKSKKNRVLFLMINIYLIVGVLTLLVTIIYLLIKLDHSDVAIRYCIPGFVMGISSAIIYYAGTQSLVSDRKSE